MRGLVQSALVRHSTQTLATVSHTGAKPPPPTQFALVKHCTQCIFDVLQTTSNPPVHWASLEHDRTQTWFAVSQTLPVEQSPSARHCTHRFVAVSQWVAPARPAQSGSDTHWTQRIVVALQTGLATTAPPSPPRVVPASTMHCALEVQTTTQVFVNASQTRPAPPQLASVTHGTQVWSVVLQKRRGAAQLVSERQPTQAPMAVSQ